VSGKVAAHRPQTAEKELLRSLVSPRAYKELCLCLWYACKLSQPAPRVHLPRRRRPSPLNPFPYSSLPHPWKSSFASSCPSSSPNRCHGPKRQ